MWVFDMVRTVEKMFRRYGTQMRLYTLQGGEDFCGFLHFITSRSWQNSKRDMTPLGETPGGHFVLLMPAGVQAAPGDTVEQYGKCFILRRLEYMYYRDKALYQWGLCVEKGGE